MFLRMKSAVVLVAVGWLLTWTARDVQAQSFGIELHNTLMPASGGMGGTSIARPQDLLSAMHGNIGSLAQYEGTQFTFSGAWIESTYSLGHNGDLPNVGNFYAKSEAEGSALATSVSHKTCEPLGSLQPSVLA